MGLFEFFQRSEKESAERRRINIDRFQRGEESADTVQKGPVTVFHPKSFKDVEKIISTLKTDSRPSFIRANSQKTPLTAYSTCSAARFTRWTAACMKWRTTFSSLPRTGSR